MQYPYFTILLLLSVILSNIILNIQAYSVSIEETNKLRAALGLKPLVVEDPKEKAKEIEQKLKDKQESEKQFKILEIGVALEKYGVILTLSFM